MIMIMIIMRIQFIMIDSLNRRLLLREPVRRGEAGVRPSAPLGPLVVQHLLGWRYLGHVGSPPR